MLRKIQWSLLCLALTSCSIIVKLVESDSAADAGPDDVGRDGGTLDGATSSGTDACSAVLADGTCVINCTTSSCDGDIVCPEGRACHVNCVGDNACENVNINCQAASSCVILCDGKDACDTGGITCGGASCQVQCIGDAACEEALTECAADSCRVQCDGANACAAGVCCAGIDCADACTSANGGNCSCPL